MSWPDRCAGGAGSAHRSFEDGRYTPEAVNTAVKPAAPRRRGIHVLVTITVPASAPIDAVMPEAEAKAQAAIDLVRMRGKRRVSGHFEKVRAGEVGRRIVLEAKQIEAAAVVMALPRGARARQSSVGRSRRCSPSARAESSSTPLATCKNRRRPGRAPESRPGAR